ncbi:putative exocyst complex component Sec8/EXOC4 [Helianthus annuus]|uniref:Exocyst complex component Sec8 n=1 Tax=Helianthus annuus TaxID=4232 RepID=A0A9K3HYT9_HELAN|nr:putative exocyst complex component Sec8/EXOC4 [Helianthus annuus]
MQNKSLEDHILGQSGTSQKMALHLPFASLMLQFLARVRADLIRKGRKRKSQNVQEGYGSASALPEHGIYLAASVYQPVVQFTDRLTLMMPQKYSQLGNDGLLAFLENLVKDHFLPTMFVDYMKGMQQEISSPAAFRPRANPVTAYTPSVSNGRSDAVTPVGIVKAIDGCNGRT